MYNVERQQNESEEEYLWRLGEAKDSGLLDMTWEELTNIINKEFREDETLYRKESSYRKRYADAKKFKTNVFEKLGSETSNDIDEKIRELQKAKIKLQTEKLEYSKWLRENARDELIIEKISDAVASLPSLEIPKYIAPQHSKKSHLLCIADAHYSIEFEIKDLFGNTINEYSPMIFEKRMWDLAAQVIEIVKEQGITELNIWELGDSCEGLLRLNSQLMKLRYGAIDSAIYYGDFLAHWLNELSKYVDINFQMVMDSNHNQLRLLNAPKNAFPEENLSKIIMLVIEKELLHNPNITIIKNPTGLNYGELSSYKVLGIHGEVKDLGKAIDDYSRVYKTNISYVVGAHIHHLAQKETAIDQEALSIRSIMGVNPYAMTLLTTANAGASLFEFEEGRGLVCDHRLKLK